MQAAGRQWRRTKAGGLAARTIAQCDGAPPACECPVCQPVESSQRRRSHGQGQRARARAQIQIRANSQLDTKSDWLAALVAMVAALRTHANRRGVSFIPNETVHGVRTGGQGVACGALLSHTGAEFASVALATTSLPKSGKEGPQPEKAFVRRIPPSAAHGSASTRVCFSA